MIKPAQREPSFPSPVPSTHLTHSLAYPPNLSCPAAHSMNYEGHHLLKSHSFVSLAVYLTCNDFTNQGV